MLVDLLSFFQACGPFVAWPQGAQELVGVHVGAAGVLLLVVRLAVGGHRWGVVA